MNKLIFKLFYSKAPFCSIFLVFIVLTGCEATGRAIGQMPAEISKKPEVYFCPKDDCGKMLEMHIKSANFSVYCAFYDVNLKNVIRELAEKSKAADVKLVIDKSNYKEQVKGDGMRLDTDGQLMHNKFCVIDNKIVVTGSFNPTNNDNYLNNNNMVVFYSSALARNYEDEFSELWNGRFGEGGNTRNQILYVNGIRVESYFCPDDKCASRIADLIKNAKSSIYFMSFSFTNEEIADSLIKRDGLDIRGIVDSSQSSSKFSQFKRLKEFGVNVKKDANKYKMHHKVFIIDNQTVATGSFNPTLSADTKNDENLLIIHDKKIANAFLGEFDSLWG